MNFPRIFAIAIYLVGLILLVINIISSLMFFLGLGVINEHDITVQLLLAAGVTHLLFARSAKPPADADSTPPAKAV